MIRQFGACGLGALLLLPAGATAQTRSLSAAASNDIATGQRIFDAQCAWCHGAGGTGGTGPDLHRTTLRHAANDRELITLVRNGIPGTEMPSFTSALTETMARQTAAYVRSLGRARERPLPGNVQHGVALYDSNGCGGCHIVSGRGNALGPELTSIGALRGAPYLRDALITPEAAHPPGYLVVKATTTAGNEIRGIRVNEDVFYVHVRDARGTLHTLQKSDLSKLERELEGTLMPSYASRITGGDLDDLVAYLASLRGGK
jgi:putative heme-binding domain-containing protein